MNYFFKIERPEDVESSLCKGEDSSGRGRWTCQRRWKWQSLTSSRHFSMVPSQLQSEVFKMKREGRTFPKWRIYTGNAEHTRLFEKHGKLHLWSFMHIWSLWYLHGKVVTTTCLNTIIWQIAYRSIYLSCPTLSYHPFAIHLWTLHPFAVSICCTIFIHYCHYCGLLVFSEFWFLVFHFEAFKNLIESL